MTKKKNFSLLRFLSSFLVFPVAGAFFSLVYVWEKIQEVKTGYRITELRRQIETADENICRIDSKIFLLKSPDKILTRIPPDLKITGVDKIVHMAKIDRASYTKNMDNQFCLNQTEYPDWLKKKFQAYIVNNNNDKEKVCYLTKNKH